MEPVLFGYSGRRPNSKPLAKSVIPATTRRRHRTFQARGCLALPVLKFTTRRPRARRYRRFGQVRVRLPEVRSAELGTWLGTWKANRVSVLCVARGLPFSSVAVGSGPPADADDVVQPGRIRAAGAEIVDELKTGPWGLRGFRP